MDKLDLKKQDKAYYSARNMAEIKEFVDIKYIGLKGMGNPNDPEFTKAINSLYALAFTIKNVCKQNGMDFVVPKLECIWWVEGGKEFTETPKNLWHWKLQIRMPDFVSGEEVEQSRKNILLKKDDKNIPEVKFETMDEGKCVQIMHTGSYESEEKTIAKIVKFIVENNLEINGHHHEIYISDPRRTSAEKLKTILRYPIKKVLR